jgi:LysR family cyn operon transcriptional activator
MAHVRPRVLLESGALSTLVALARVGYGIAIVPSNVRIPSDDLRVVPLVQRGAAIGRWLGVAWDPRRFLAPYGEDFVEELARRAPPLPRPPESRPGQS